MIIPKKYNCQEIERPGTIFFSRGLKKTTTLVSTIAVGTHKSYPKYENIPLSTF